MDRRIKQRRAAAAWMLILAITGVPLFFLIMLASARAQAPVKTGPLLRQLDGSDINNPATFRTNLGLGAVATQSPSAVAITGGTINGTPIGGTTRAAGSFTSGSFSTTLGVTGAATFSSTLAVTGTSTLGPVIGRSFSVPLTGFPAYAGDNPVPAVAAFRTAVSGYTKVLGSYVTVGSSSDGVRLLRGAGGSMDYLNVAGRVTAGYQGGRTAVDGSVLEPEDAPTSRFRWTTGIIGGKFSATSNNASGGIADGFGVSQFGAGTTTALNTLTLLSRQYGRGMTGQEIDIKASAGASFFSGGGLLIAQTPGHEVAPIKDWAAFYVANAGGVLGGQWKTLTQYGSNGSAWPVSHTGILIAARMGNNYTAYSATARGGIDLREASLTEFVSRHRGGETRQGDHGGAVQVGYATLGSRSTGAYLDTGVSRTSGVTLVNPGSGYSPGDVVGTNRDVMIKVESRITVPITAVSQANPARITSAGHGLANGTMFDITVDDPEAETEGTCTVMSGMTELACQSIASITQANPGVLNVPNHGLPSGAFARLSGVGGMTQLSGMPYYVVRPIAANTLSLEFPDGTPVDTTLFDPYTSGGRLRISYRVANADADGFDIQSAQGGNVSSANWSEYVSGGRVLTYIPDQVSLLIPDWSTTPETTGVATTHRVRRGRQYGSGMTVDLTNMTVVPLRLQSTGNPTYAGGMLASATTAAGLVVQTRGIVQARTATVSSLVVVDGGEYASKPDLVFPAPSGSGTTATGQVATMGGKGVASFSGGANYRDGDIVTLSGGTSSQTAQFRVTEVDDPITGVPTAVVLYRAGSYSVQPSSPVSVISGSPGTGLTITPTWTVLTATVSDPGTNYAEFPPVTVTTSGGGPVTAAEIEATMAGAAATLSLNPSGAATVAGGPVAVGGGSLNLTTAALGIARMAASGSAPGPGGGKVELVCGTNAGTARLVVYAGTSGTAVVLGDNIGAGVTGC